MQIQGIRIITARGVLKLVVTLENGEQRVLYQEPQGIILDHFIDLAKLLMKRDTVAFTEAKTVDVKECLRCKKIRTLREFHTNPKHPGQKKKICRYCCLTLARIGKY